jgi:hypothetical protein
VWSLHGRGGDVAAVLLEAGRAPISTVKTNLQGLGSAFGCHAPGPPGAGDGAKDLALCVRATAQGRLWREDLGTEDGWALLPSVSIPLAFYLQEPLDGSRQI